MSKKRPPYVSEVLKAYDEEQRLTDKDGETSSTDDPVNHPKHYNSHPSGVECIAITRHHSFNIGNAIKYLWRAGLKDGVTRQQDLKKAIWYIEDELGLHG
jgi:hypothetical protein